MMECGDGSCCGVPGCPCTDVACPLCGGPGVVLGTLGYILHLRCQDCGADFSTDSPDSYEEV